MNITRQRTTFLISLVFVLYVDTLVFARNLPDVEFNGLVYEYRDWADDDRLEYTALNENDISAWENMLSLVFDDNVTTEDDLGTLADGLYNSYTREEKLLKR